MQDTGTLYCGGAAGGVFRAVDTLKPDCHSSFTCVLALGTGHGLSGLHPGLAQGFSADLAQTSPTGQGAVSLPPFAPPALLSLSSHG